MKKNRIRGRGTSSSWNKCYRIMKLTTLFFLIGLMQLSANVYSQSTKLTLEMRNKKVVEVLEEIEKQSEFRFAYSSELIDMERKVSVDINKKNIEETLHVLFAGTGVKHVVYDRHIMLYPEEMDSKTESLSNQQNTITGKVVDENGEELPGVTVLVKGTTNGAVTNVDGNYTLGNIPEGATLEFSFIGMLTQEIVIGNQTTIDVIMQVDAIGIEEVVAVGYGTQKKVNLTGSVAHITSEELDNIPFTQASQVLSGLASGVTVMQGSGQPGKDNATIRIRGLGTFSNAGNSPLVLIDGLAANINDVDPNDIESISVLKDAASAAIYGSRAANGVILIETKKGKKGQIEVNYNGYFGVQKPTQLPQFVDSWEYATLENEAYKNEGKNVKWLDEEIQKFKTGENSENYPNKNHYEDLVTSGSGFQTNHNLQFNGGSKDHTYLLSLGYLDQEGIIEETDFNRYNMRLNLNSKLNDKLNLKLNLSGNHSNRGEPVSAGKQGMNDASQFVKFAVRTPSYLGGRKADGTYDHIAGFTIEGWLDSESFISVDKENFLGNISLEYDIFKNLKLTGKAGYLLDQYEKTVYQAELVVDKTLTQGPAELTISNGKNTLVTLQALLDYDLEIGEHELHILAGYSQEEFKHNWSTAYRDDFPTNTLYTLNAGSTENMQSSGSGYEWALTSFFGRFNYSFHGKYLFEGNVRYDGSSRFPAENRYGIFPSFSAGWRISEESFMESISWIDNLKFRSSWGKLGNQQIGNYPYQQTVSLGLGYPLGGANETIYPGAAPIVLPNTEITWESTRVLNFGIDLSVLNGKFNLSAEYFNKKTNDILYNISTAKVLGLMPSEQNAGTVKNEGWEIDASHRNTLGDFSYNITGNFSVGNNSVLKIAQLEKDIPNGLFIGESLRSIYGYMADGLFVDQGDIDSYPEQPYSASPGDIRYMDISGPEGVPDGIVNAEYDRKVIGNKFPKYAFGANISSKYKNFDLAMHFQGIAGLDNILTGYIGRALYLSSNPQRWMYDNRWTQENPNRDATYPRVLNLTEGDAQNYTSTYWLRSASFLRLNNLQIGYTFSPKIMNTLKVKNLRIYINATNLFTLDNYYSGWDPEVDTDSAGDGGHYPTTSVYSIGINVKF